MYREKWPIEGGTRWRGMPLTSGKQAKSDVAGDIIIIMYVNDNLAMAKMTKAVAVG